MPPVHVQTETEQKEPEAVFSAVQKEAEILYHPLNQLPASLKKALSW